MSTLPINHTAQRGFTMVELLVALAVGLFLTAGVMQIFVSSGQTYRSLDASSRVGENARYALNSLVRDLRMSGFMGCRSISEGIAVSYAGATGFSGVSHHNMIGDPVGLLGYENGAADNGLAAEAWDNFFNSSTITRVEGTDVVQVMFADGRGTRLSAGMDSAAAELHLEGNPDRLKNGFAIVTDCVNISVVRLQGLSESLPLPHAGLDRPYDEGALVFPLVAHAYFVGRGGAGCIDNSCLYRRTLGVTRTDSLVTGIEDLQLMYGEDTNGDGAVDGYSNAAGVVDWGRVSSVRMGLLLRSEAEVTTDAQRYVFKDPNTVFGDPVDAVSVASDRGLRAPYWVTVSLRNSLP